MGPSKTRTVYDMTKKRPANEDLKRDVTELRRDVSTLAGILQNTNAMLALLALQLNSTQTGPSPGRPADPRIIN